MKRSKIEWTDFSGGVLNFVNRGTTKGDCELSPGCANCYALAILNRFRYAGPITRFNETKLEGITKAKFDPGDTPFRRGPGSRPMAFVCDMGDLFHDHVSAYDLRKSIEILSDRPDVDFQILTKRARRMAANVGAYYRRNVLIDPISNLWFGVSVENQSMADQRIPQLTQTPAAVRFLSLEPLLGPVDLTPYFGNINHPVTSQLEKKIHWVIVGQETGPNKRPMPKGALLDIANQCYDHDIPLFIKSAPEIEYNPIVDQFGLVDILRMWPGDDWGMIPDPNYEAELNASFMQHDIT